MPVIEITGVETMIIADALMEEEKAEELSGVNLLFLDPEYFKSNDFDWSVDLWSIGAIIYLLITGGISEEFDKELREPYDFREKVWYNLDDYVLHFVKLMMQSKPSNRATI